MIIFSQITKIGAKMRFAYQKIHWEIVIAIAINSLILLIFLVCKVTVPQKADTPVEVSLDISDFKPQTPKEMKISDSSDATNGRENESITKMSDGKNIESITSEAFHEVSPQIPFFALESPRKTAVEHQQELERIEHGIRTFDGINQVKAGIRGGGLPEGHQTGASFQGRSDGQNRAKLLKKHGGNAQTESAVEKALDYLASVQNPNGSWGTSDSFKTGDAAALSSLALLAFFSHGENFQSKKYGKTIRKGCDFLIELSNTPNIEYAGKGFGHAILTYALAEGFAVTGSFSLRNSLERRMRYIISHQNSFGSFAINYDNSPQAPPTEKQLENPLFREIVVGEPNCDLSLLGWHIQAMTAAKNAGLQIDGQDRALTLALEALVKIHQADKGGFSQGINMKRFPHSDDMTPVGLLGMFFLNARSSSPAKHAARILKKMQMPKWKNGGNFPIYRWYYQTQVLFQLEKGRGKRWDAWNENLKNELVKAQSPDGSWSMPAGDNSFRVKDKTDLSIYSSSLCSLMLQVYYRYLPSYSIAESSAFNETAEALDLGKSGLVSRLPGGPDPLAGAILGTGVDSMPPITFGTFNGIPDTVDAPLANEEFLKLASLRSTIPVRKPDDWPQTLQINQRIAVFFDELLPRNFKGHMRFLIGIVGSEKSAIEYQQSVEVVLNGKRLYNSYLLCGKQLVEIVIPNDTVQPFGNILQIRNNGKSPLAFDAAELSSLNKVGDPLYLFAGDRSKVPSDLYSIFSKKWPQNAVVCKLSALSENKQLLQEITSYDPQKVYVGEYSAIGNEVMGNEFHKHYLNRTGREIVDWIAGGGSGIKINSIMTGGRLYDSIFHEEYPAVSALRQTAKLFEGAPRKLSSQIYPKYGEQPGLFLSSAASYNAPGVATVIIARRFPFPEESEIITLVPWNGETEMLIERGFLPEKSPFIGFASKVQRERKKVIIKDNIFRFSAVFSELTVIRLIRKGAKELPKSSIKNLPVLEKIKFNHNTVRHQFPYDISKMVKTQIRQAGGHASIFGQNVTCSKIPATVITPKQNKNRFTPTERESVCVTFQIHQANPKRFDSAYLMFGNAPTDSQFLTFNIFTRISGLKKKNRMSWTTFRFALCGKLYSTTVRIDSWEKVIIPLKNTNPAWQSLRILEPVGIFDKKLQTISFEINDVAVYSLGHAP